MIPLPFSLDIMLPCVSEVCRSESSLRPSTSGYQLAPQGTNTQFSISTMNNPFHGVTAAAKERGRAAMWHVGTLRGSTWASSQVYDGTGPRWVTTSPKDIATFLISREIKNPVYFVPVYHVLSWNFILQSFSWRHKDWAATSVDRV